MLPSQGGAKARALVRVCCYAHVMSLAIIKARLAQALDLTDALAGALSDETVRAYNGKAKSNSIGEQFWCLVGARESYTRAIEAGAWAGFNCSLGGDDIKKVETIRDALTRTHAAAHAAIDKSALSDAQIDLIMSLAEHEVQHHGQLIRYFYANGIAFPPAFAGRYALD